MGLHEKAQFLRIVRILGRECQQGFEKLQLQRLAGIAFFVFAEGLVSRALFAGGVDRHPRGFQISRHGHHAGTHGGGDRIHPVDESSQMVLYGVVRAVGQFSQPSRQTGFGLGSAAPEMPFHKRDHLGHLRGEIGTEIVFCLFASGPCRRLGQIIGERIVQSGHRGRGGGDPGGPVSRSILDAQTPQMIGGEGGQLIQADVRRIETVDEVVLGIAHHRIVQARVSVAGTSGIIQIWRGIPRKKSQLHQEISGMPIFTLNIGFLKSRNPLLATTIAFLT